MTADGDDAQHHQSSLDYVFEMGEGEGEAATGAAGRCSTLEQDVNAYSRLETDIFGGDSDLEDEYELRQGRTTIRLGFIGFRLGERGGSSRQRAGRICGSLSKKVCGFSFSCHHFFSLSLPLLKAQMSHEDQRPPEEARTLVHLKRLV